MIKILKLALNDLRLTTRDRWAFFWMLVFPLAFMWLFGSAFSGGATGPARVTLGVVDRDGGWLASAFVDELRDESVNLIELPSGWEPFTPEALQPTRWVVLPEGFTGKVLAGEQQTLRLEMDGNGDEQYSMTAQIRLVRAIARVLGRLVEIDAAGEEEELVDPARLEEGFRALAERPALVSLEVDRAGEGQAVPTGYFQSVPGILAMTVLMMTVIYGAVFLTTEKQQGMLRRQATLPVSRAHIFLGKLLGRFLMASLQIAILLAAGRFIFGVSWGSSPLALALVLASYAAAASGLATLLGAVLSTPEQAGGLGWILSMALAALGGCWWPSEVMPEWMWSAAHLLPTAWAMDALHSLISFGRGLEAVLVPSAALLGFALLFSLLGSRFLRYD